MASDSDQKEKELSGEMAHDDFVYIIWTNVLFAKLFIARFMAPEIACEIDLDSLELASSRHVDEKGRNSIGDVFYKFRFKSGKRGVLGVLMEHKSGYAHFVAIQILRYEVDALEYMANNADKFVDENGLLPIPYSILLCQKRHPQLEEITSRLQGVEYGPRTRFQEVNFNDVDLDSLSDEPFLQIAIGLSQFAGYSEKLKDERQNELDKLFQALLHYDAAKKGSRREVWELIFKVSCNYLSYLMRDHDFKVGRFVFNLIDKDKECDMDYALYPEIFADMFPRELQPYREQIAVANAKVSEATAKVSEATARASEAAARADKSDRLLCESIRKCVRTTIKARRWFDETPQSLADDLERITSYENLNDALTAAENAENYVDFLKTFERLLANSK